MIPVRKSPCETEISIQRNSTQNNFFQKKTCKSGEEELIEVVIFLRSVCLSCALEAMLASNTSGFEDLVSKE